MASPRTKPTVAAVSAEPAVEPRDSVYRLDNGQFPMEQVMALDPSAFEASYPSRSAVVESERWRKTSVAAKASLLTGADGTDEEPVYRPYDIVNGVAVIDIMGPLGQRAGWYWDGYDWVGARFAIALSDPKVLAVALRIDSPGGAAAGAFETAMSMRRAKLAAKKPVMAYADEMAASGGYALAAVADEIWLPESGLVGSVGVIGVLSEQSALLKKIGIRVEVLTTGAQKSDGHPAVALTEEVVKRYQQRIDHLGDLFFALVADARGMSTKDVSGLEAAVFQGSKAIKAGLANGVGSFDEFMVGITKTIKTGTTKPRQEKIDMSTENAEKTGTGAGGTNSLPDYKAIAIAVGLAPEASERDILHRVSALRGGHDELLKLGGKSTVQEALGVLQAGVIAAAEVPALRKQVADLKTSEASREVDSLIEGAKAAGKVTSAATEAELRSLGSENVTRLRTLIGALPVVVTTDKTATKEGPAPGDILLSEEEKLVCKQVGLTHQQFIEQKRARAQEGV